MEQLLNNYSLSDIIIFSFFAGIIFNIIQDLINSLIEYIQNKAWLVNDYERIIYSYNKNSAFEFSEEDMNIEDEAIKNYEKRMKKRENLEKFLNKFRKNK